jgi:hypothetical protein
VSRVLRCPQGWCLLPVWLLTPTPVAASVSPPDAALRLEWVHGYRGGDVRNNVFYTVDGSVAYPAARVGVVYNAVQRKQRFMLEHSEDIVSMAMHPVSPLACGPTVTGGYDACLSCHYLRMGRSWRRGKWARTPRSWYGTSSP